MGRRGFPAAARLKEPVVLPPCFSSSSRREGLLKSWSRRLENREESTDIEALTPIQPERRVYSALIEVPYTRSRWLSLLMKTFESSVTEAAMLRKIFCRPSSREMRARAAGTAAMQPTSRLRRRRCLRPTIPFMSQRFAEPKSET